MMTPSARQDSYDAMPYPSLPNRHSHPCHLGAIGRLFDLPCKSPQNCRVLELGCAAGGNLLPLAVDYPESEFVGIDRSARQVAEGQEAIAALALDNLAIQHQDILDISEELGKFDYVICHGVFSWVPRQVQQRILELCRRLLAEHGVAYISYNTYPGWHLRAIVRDMMQYHARTQTEPVEQVVQARALLDFLVNHAADNQDAYRQILSQEAAVLNARADSYLFHEHLEDINEPLYFHQFLSRARQTGLEYVGDTDFSTMLPDSFGSEVTTLLKSVALEVQEQYMDFLRNRMFRSSLLCHSERILDRRVQPARLFALDVSLQAPAQPVLPIDLPQGELLEFQFGADRIRVQAPITQAALLELSHAHPEPIRCEQLWQAAQNRIAGQEAPDRSRRVLAEDLLLLFARRIVRLSLDAARCASKPDGTPVASPLARWQTTRGSVVTNRRHVSIQLSETSRRVLGLLDGRHDLTSLTNHLVTQLARGELHLHLDGQPVKDPSRELVAQAVEQALRTLAYDSLLLPADQASGRK